MVKDLVCNVKHLGCTLEKSFGYNEDSLKCPNCGSEYIHIEQIAVAPGGEIYLQSETYEQGPPFPDELTHRKRDKVITFFSCEGCGYPEYSPHNGDPIYDPPQLIRIEVVHKGILQSGIYSTKTPIDTTNLYILPVFERD